MSDNQSTRVQGADGSVFHFHAVAPDTLQVIVEHAPQTPEGYLSGLHEDGSLQIVQLGDYQHDDLPTQMEKSVALAQKLFSNGHLGCDVIYMLPHGRFPLHTHPGHHLLLILKGSGTVTYGGRVYETLPGELYFVPGEVEHAVGGGPAGHWLLSIGAPHKPADSEERMEVREDGMANDDSARQAVLDEVVAAYVAEGRDPRANPALARLLDAQTAAAAAAAAAAQRPAAQDQE